MGTRGGVIHAVVMIVYCDLVSGVLFPAVSCPVSVCYQCCVGRKTDTFGGRKRYCV